MEDGFLLASYQRRIQGCRRPLQAKIEVDAGQLEVVRSLLDEPTNQNSAKIDRLYVQRLR